MSIYNTAPYNNLVEGGKKVYSFNYSYKKKKNCLLLYMQMSPGDQPMNSIVNQPYNKQLN